MKNYTTKLSKQKNNIPTMYDFQKILYIRRNRNADNQELKYSFYRMEKGLEGENLLLDFLKKYGKKHWIIFQNVWLDFYGRFECDSFLVTSTNCYAFEVKNYDGFFTYKEGQCYLNQKKLAQNCVAQAERARLNLHNIFREANFSCYPKGVLLFTGENCWLDFQTKVDEIQVLMPNQLKYFFHQVAIEERNSVQKIDSQRLVQILEQHTVENPFLPEPIGDDGLKQLRKGIYCIKCEGFDLNFTHFYVVCKCGYREKRDQAIIRTICEFGVLNYDKHLRIGALHNFFGQQISRQNLFNVLQANFESKNKGKYSYYYNKKLPYEKLLK